MAPERCSGGFVVHHLVGGGATSRGTRLCRAGCGGVRLDVLRTGNSARLSPQQAELTRALASVHPTTHSIQSGLAYFKFAGASVPGCEFVNLPLALGIQRTFVLIPRVTLRFSEAAFETGRGIQCKVVIQSDIIDRPLRQS